MRVVVTAKGLDVSLALKRDVHSKIPGLSPTPRTEETTLLPQLFNNPSPKRKPYQTRYFRLISSPPKPRIRLAGNSSKARHLLESTETSRKVLEKKIKRRMKEMHEHDTECQISFLTVRDTLPFPENDRPLYLKNLREEHHRRYGRSWNWLESKRFSLPTGNRKSLSPSDRK